MVADEASATEAEFVNLRTGEVVDDLDRFISSVRMVNPGVKIILTVSPVALIATYEDRHVLVSTVASKSALRAAADEVERSHGGVTYFPSYEIITGPQARSKYFAPDCREVTPEGVSFVMSIFSRHFFAGNSDSASNIAAAAPDDPMRAVATGVDENSGVERRKEALEKMRTIAGIVCDEEAIVRS